jgi:hypothetical protein
MGAAGHGGKGQGRVYFRPRGRFHAGLTGCGAYKARWGIPPILENEMAKGQRKSNKEVRKPKAEKGPKQNASNPSLKPGGIKGLENMKNG